MILQNTLVTGKKMPLLPPPQVYTPPLELYGLGLACFILFICVSMTERKCLRRETFTYGLFVVVFALCTLCIHAAAVYFLYTHPLPGWAIFTLTSLALGSLCWFRSDIVYDDHARVVRFIFDVKLSEEVGEVVQSKTVLIDRIAKKNGFQLCWMMLVYIFVFVIYLLMRLFDSLWEFYSDIFEISARTIRRLAKWFTSWWEYITSYMCHVVAVPFHYFMDGLQCICRYIGAEIKPILETIRTAGNIVIHLWRVNKKQALWDWIGDGFADDQTYNKLVAFVFMYVLFNLCVLALVCGFAWMVYGIYIEEFTIPYTA